MFLSNMLNIPNPLLIRVVSTYLYTTSHDDVHSRSNIFFVLNLIGKKRCQLSTETPKNPDFWHEKRLILDVDTNPLYNLAANESFVNAFNRPILTIIKTGKKSMIIENVNIGLLIALDLAIS